MMEPEPLPSRGDRVKEKVSGDDGTDYIYHAGAGFLINRDVVFLIVGQRFSLVQS